MNFYVSIFKNSKILTLRQDRTGRSDRGLFNSMTGIHGTKRWPAIAFTEAISFFVHCETQAEVERGCGKSLRQAEKVKVRAGSKTNLGWFVANHSRCFWASFWAKRP